MFSYLVNSKTRRGLLETLWRDASKGTASSLARKAKVPVAPSYGELKAMARAGLARESLESGRLVYEAEWDSPYAGALEQLASAPTEKAKASKPKPDDSGDDVRNELAAQGAPLWGSMPNVRPTVALSEIVAQACLLAHDDPSVARVLPHLLVQKTDELDFEQL